jgi:hypothetical protein
MSKTFKDRKKKGYSEEEIKELKKSEILRRAKKKGYSEEKTKFKIKSKNYDENSNL